MTPNAGAHPLPTTAPGLSAEAQQFLHEKGFGYLQLGLTYNCDGSVQVSGEKLTGPAVSVALKAEVGLGVWLTASRDDSKRGKYRVDPDINKWLPGSIVNLSSQKDQRFDILYYPGWASSGRFDVEITSAEDDSYQWTLSLPSWQPSMPDISSCLAAAIDM